jgi:hypothetical protein
MITPDQRRTIEARAYVPEHWPGYVTAVSPVEPFRIGDFVAYVGQARLIFVGYPLGGAFEETELAAALEEAINRFKPGVVSIIGPAPPASLPDCVESPADAYYRLDLSALTVPQKVRNMLNRAGRELSIFQVERCGREHKKLIKAFLRHHRLDEATQSIFEKIPEYAKTSTARIFEARTGKGKLIAFDVAEFGAKDYAFYMFNICSKKQYVPGASDLLLARVIEQARREGKRHLNLGLGINPGVTFFKTKWGGVPFLRHVACLHQRSGVNTWEDILDGLM